MSNLHDNFKNKLYDLIYKKDVTFIDQFGNKHEVFDKEKGFIFKEIPYFYNEPEISMHNNGVFPCQKYVKDYSDFEPVCNNEKVETGEFSGCRSCMYMVNKENFEIDESLIKKEILIPDISTGKDGKFDYWIEVVQGHPCSEYKRQKLKELGIICLEVSLNSIYMAGKEDGKYYLNCFDITSIDVNEYVKVKKVLSLENKIFEYNHEINNLMGNNYKSNVYNPIIKKAEKATKAKVFTIKQKNEIIKPVKKEVKKTINKAIYNEILRGMNKSFFSKLENALLTKNVSHKDVIDYVDKYVKDNDLIIDYDFDTMRKEVDKHIRKYCNASILDLTKDSYDNRVLEKFSLTREKTIFSIERSREIFKVMQQYK